PRRHGNREPGLTGRDLPEIVPPDSFSNAYRRCRSTIARNAALGPRLRCAIWNRRRNDGSKWSAYDQIQAGDEPERYVEAARRDGRSRDATPLAIRTSPARGPASASCAP